MTGYRAALNRLRIGADAPSNPGRPLGVAAVQTYAAQPGHKPWYLWALRKNGDIFTKEGDKESDVADAFGYFGMSSTPYGDLSDIVYGVYWDTTNRDPSNGSIGPTDEYAGTITIKPDPTPTPTPQKSGGWGGWILGIIGAGVGLVFLGKRSK